VKLGKNESGTCAMLSKAYGGEAMKKSNISEWHKWFKEGHENVEKDERSDCSRSHRTNENAEKMQNLVQTVNKAYYVEILKQLSEAVFRKRLELWPNDWIFHHDNASAHKVLSVKQFLAQKSISEMEHPPYSSDQALDDLGLFPKIRSALKG
jgi:hypothetical protein